MARRFFVLATALISLAVSTSALASPFVFAANARVEKQLRRLERTASSRADVKEAVARFRTHGKMLLETARKHGVPQALLAIPFVESRYRNLEEHENYLGCCAGLWQLDRRTARSLGLTVTKKTDERLDVTKATDAAMAHLAELHAEFGSWEHAIVAYNIGKTRLRRIMRVTGERDPWQLARLGHIGPFLTKVAAAAHVMAPEVDALRPSVRLAGLTPVR